MIVYEAFKYNQEKFHSFYGFSVIKVKAIWQSLSMNPIKVVKIQVKLS